MCVYIYGTCRAAWRRRASWSGVQLTGCSSACFSCAHPAVYLIRNPN